MFNGEMSCSPIDHISSESRGEMEDPEGSTHLRDSAGLIGTGEEGSFRNSASSNEQVNAPVQVAQQEQAKEGDVLLALILSTLHQLSKPSGICLRSVEQQ